MDAKRAPLILYALGLSVLAGCQLTPPMSQPTTRTPPVDNAKPLIVNLRQPTPAAESVHTADREVLEYVRQVGSLSQRAAATRTAFDGKPKTARRRSRSEPSRKAAQPSKSDANKPDGGSNAPANSAPAALSEADSATEQASEPQPKPKLTQPPRLANVSVRARGAPRREISRAAQAKPGVNETARAALSAGDFETLLDTWVQAARADASFRGQLDLRLMHVLRGEYEQARSPIDSVPDTQRSMAARLIEALIAIRDGHMGDPAGAAAAGLEAVANLAAELREASDLQISNLTICRVVTGFGQYDEIDPPRFPTLGPSEFVTYVEIANFVTRPDRDGWHETRFDMRTVIMTRAGYTVHEIKDTNIIDRCRSRRTDCYIARTVQLPAALSPGDYVAKVTIVDKLGEKVAERQTSFRVVSGS